MNTKHDQMLSTVLDDAVEYAFDAFRDAGVDSANARVMAEYRVRAVIRDIIFERLNKVQTP